MGEEVRKRKKHGGRVKGTPNKVTREMRDAVARLLDEYQESGLMAEDFAKLKPGDRIAMAEKLMQYTTPKLQAIALSDDGEKHFTIEDRLVELAEENEVQTA